MNDNNDSTKKKTPKKKTQKAKENNPVVLPESKTDVQPSSKTEQTISAYIDRAEQLKKKQAAVFEAVKSFIENQNYYYRIDQIFEPSPVPVIGIISPKGGSGKSSFALTFSSLLSSLGIKVLLADYDFVTHGLSLLLTNSEKFQLYNKEEIVTVEDIIEHIVERKGQVDKYLIQHKEHFFNRIEHSPEHIPLAHNLYAILGKLVNRAEVSKNPHFATLAMLLNDSIFEFIIKNFTLSRQNFYCIVVDVSAGLFSESILKHISHPIFLTEVGLDSIRGIERLHSIWRETAENFDQLKFSSKIGRSQPYLLYNKISNYEDIEYAVKLHQHHTKNHFYLLPPLPFVSQLKESTSKRRFVDALSQMTPYILQIYEIINALFPSFQTETVLSKRHEKAKTDFSIIPDQIEAVIKNDGLTFALNNRLHEYKIISSIRERYAELEALEAIVTSGPIRDFSQRSHAEDYNYHKQLDEDMTQCQYEAPAEEPPPPPAEEDIFDLDVVVEDVATDDSLEEPITLENEATELPSPSGVPPQVTKRGYYK